MIQSSDSSRLYVGNNSITVPYPVPFVFHDIADLIVVVRDEAGIEDLQLLGTDYTVTGANNPSGGSIVTTWPVPISHQVSIVRTVPLTQLTSYEEGDSFPAKSHERALDKLTMGVQQNARGLGDGTGNTVTDVGTTFRITEASGTLNSIPKKPNTSLGVDDAGQSILRTPNEMLIHLGQVGSAWADDAARMGTRGAYVGQLGVQINNWAIYEARSTNPGDWQAFLRYNGLVTSQNGVVGAVPLPAGDIVGSTESQTLYNKTLIEPSIQDPTGMEPKDVGLDQVDNTSDEDKPVSVPVLTALLSKQDLAERAQPNGYATLDTAGKLTAEQIPDAALVGSNLYKGTWNATTGLPAIPVAAPANNGWHYLVNVAGTTTIDGISSWAVGDHVISNGSVWQKVTSTSAVASVNSKTGVVVLNKTDIGLPNVDNTSDATKNSATATLTNKTINGADNTLSVRLGADVTGNLPVANLNGGTGASATTWWCGDQSWKRPPGTGDVSGVESSVTGELVIFDSVDGKAIGKYAGPAGFAKIAPNTAVTASLVTPSDLDPSIIHGQEFKTVLVDDDEFLVWDSVTGTFVKALRASVGVPVGTILDFAGNEAQLPAGFLICAGQAVARTGVYAKLFATIGVLWGAGDGTTTFAVPDLRGRLVAGKDNMGGTNASRLSTMGAAATTIGGTGGAQTHVLTQAELAAHVHNTTVNALPTVVAAAPFASGGSGPLASGGAIGLGNATYYSAAQGYASDSRGSNGAHNNLQPTRIVNKIIRF